MFIKLTLSSGHSNTRTVLLNIDAIQNVCPSLKSEDHRTIINCGGDNNFYYVEESLETIEQLLFVTKGVLHGNTN